ncbi:MAG: NUDIX hydrolase [Bacteroidales bacterium]
MLELPTLGEINFGMTSRLNPHVSVDCVVFGFDTTRLKVLLVERNSKKGQTAKHKLPGSLVYNTETLADASQRVLKELTGLENIFLQQFHVFDSPDRIKDDEDRAWLESTSGLQIERVISIGYYSLVNFSRTNKYLDALRHEARWIPVGKEGLLAFDHNEILNRGLEVLREKIRTEPLLFELLPDKFTIRQLQKLYEIILNQELDNRNFRKKILQLKYLIPLDEKQTNVAHKPARLYSFDRKTFQKFRKNNNVFAV